MRLASLTLAVLFIGCGPSLMQRARDAAPHAIARHLEGSQVVDVTGLVEVPTSVAWNATVDAVRQQAPIADASPATRTVETDWTYETQVDPGVARQRRTRHTVRLEGDDAPSFGTTVASTSETREREQCAEAGPWRQEAPGPSHIEASTQQALQALRTIQLDQITFPGSADDLIPLAADVVLGRWGLTDGADAQAGAVRSAVREQTGAVVAEDLRVDVRSAVTMVPRATAEGVQFDIDARLEWRGASSEEDTGWMSEPADGVAMDAMARLMQRVRPRVFVRPMEVPLEMHAGFQAEPTLPSPPALLAGPYRLHVRLALAPLVAPGGGVWDPGAQILGTLVEWAPTIYRAARVLMGDPASAIQLAVDLYQATRRDGIEDRIAAQVGQMVGTFAAPDMMLGLMLPGGGVGLAGPDNSPVASWLEPLDVHLSGGGRIEWIMVDRDPFQADEMSRGSMSIEELANACAAVCQQRPDGSQLCLELERVR